MLTILSEVEGQIPMTKIRNKKQEKDKRRTSNVEGVP